MPGSEEEEASLKRLEIALGTTLVGFYAAKVSSLALIIPLLLLLLVLLLPRLTGKGQQHYEYGISSLGVISAAI